LKYSEALKPNLHEDSSVAEAGSMKSVENRFKDEKSPQAAVFAHKGS
jgi:hypothetical protein